ncbi:hypothetical protein PILCRDRAFT_813274 [Piloderma croceum F 1598]|uniref:Uncharacterized protein n=1 Tax=Piloderma croceum (strain F 1598) TaxID=765440 RepID=A0A0C3CHS4_PILCF|nr:hypothetical protein PILCRDRAFT_813274 [Piloderma croceum F 1598]
MEWDLTDLGIKVSPNGPYSRYLHKTDFCRYSSNSMPIFSGWDLDHVAGLVKGLDSGFKPGASLVSHDSA